MSIQGLLVLLGFPHFLLFHHLFAVESVSALLLALSTWAFALEKAWM